MAKAYVNGVECTIYDFMTNEDGYMYCKCFYPSLGITSKVPASQIEVRYE